MNTILPAGIESYLKEAGFSATEMLVLRKLLEEESLTVRELASKTGKSTGVLDQAMKKLLSKRIVVKGTINNQPRYSIQSLDTIVRWVKNDMQERKNNLDRKHQNFESFIASIKLDRTRPDIEHYTGKEGLEQAYLRLLDSGEELLTITPILTSIEDDPLRQFKVDFFRKRQARKIFQRVLAPDTSLARRFQSRDPFEYRKTLLLPEQDLPVTFEKIITDSIVACFNHENHTASFLKYPDLAQQERAAFETLWNRALNPKNTSPTVTKTPNIIPLKTRILSSFREFILSPRSIIALVLFAILAATLTFGLYTTNRDLNLERMKERVTAIAATGALQFEASDIDAIREPEDIGKPEYAKLIAILNLIRRSNSNIEYTYIMRGTENPKEFTFVADADSLHPEEKKDLNYDGVIDEADALNTPGELYVAENDPLMAEGFHAPVAGFAQNQWGNLISGYAPIVNEKGEPIALLGIDVFADEIDRLSAETFTPLYIFITLFILFALIRFTALNRSLCEECVLRAMKNKRVSLTRAAFIAMLVGLLFFGVQHYRFQRKIDEVGKRLMAIAVTVANDFDPEDLDQLHWARDMKTEAYQRVFNQLNDIRNKNPEIGAAYIVRTTADPKLFEFVGNSDANYNLPQYLNVTIDDTTLNEESDLSPWPGYIYEDFFPVFSLATKRPGYAYTPVDKWGSAITGLAPIFDHGRLVGILGLDVVVDKGESYE